MKRWVERIHSLSGWLGGIAFVVLCLTTAAGLGLHALAVPYFEADIFQTSSPATGTPSSDGVAYRMIEIHSHGRTLQAWAVDAGPDTPAVLYFHGNGETINDSASMQAYLYRHHVSSMAFDYSGFGKSTGKPTVHNLDQDANAAWRTFASWTGNRPKFTAGYSLGTGVLLHSVGRFEPKPAGVIVYGAFSSARDLLVYIRALPPWFVPLVPDLWNNVTAAAHLRIPLLVAAGANDLNVPPMMGRQIALYASDVPGSGYIAIPDVGHGGLLSHMDAVWPPILTFIREQSLNAAKSPTQHGAASSASR